MELLRESILDFFYLLKEWIFSFKVKGRFISIIL